MKIVTHFNISCHKATSQVTLGRQEETKTLLVVTPLEITKENCLFIMMS